MASSDLVWLLMAHDDVGLLLIASKVLEYCEGGDLCTALREPTAAGFFWRIVSGVTGGMLCLHTNGLTHGDLKSPNILLDHRGDVKLTDFGLAVHESTVSTPRSAQSKVAVEGTFRWMAPEVARRLGFRKPADVYSFAMVLFELLTHQLPFADMAALHAVAIVSVHGARPPLPVGTPAPIVALILRCWSEDPNDRLSFEDIEQAHVAARAALDADALLWLDAPTGHPVYEAIDEELEVVAETHHGY